MICNIFNEITKWVHIPIGFKTGLLVSLYKGNGKAKELKDSYRGVTLLPAINKLYEKCVMNRMKPFLENINFPATLQHASRKGYNNIMTSFLVQESIYHHTERGGKVYTCFLDIEKCFDHMWWNGLFYKLYNLGIRDKLWCLIHEWFTNSRCMVLANGITSETFNISRSIKQGGMMSMMNCCIYIADIHQYIAGDDNCGLKVDDIVVVSPTLADDIMLMSPTKHGLDVMITRAVSYSKRWRFRFSGTKTKCMVFGESRVANARNCLLRKFYIDGNRLEEVPYYRHVGMQISATGTSKERTRTMCSKGTSVLSAMVGIGVKRDGTHPLVSTFLWNRLCLPSMLHGCEMCGTQTSQEMIQLERAQCRALKQIQGLPYRTHNVIVRGMVDQMPRQSIMDIKKCIFLHKLLTMKDCIHKQLLIKRLYEHILSYGVTGFVGDIWNITIKYGLNNFIMRYLHGGTLPNKAQWQNVVKESVIEYNRHDYPHYSDSVKYTQIFGEAGCQRLHINSPRHCPRRDELFQPNTLDFLRHSMSIPHMVCQVL